MDRNGAKPKARAGSKLELQKDSSSAAAAVLAAFSGAPRTDLPQ